MGREDGHDQSGEILPEEAGRSRHSPHLTWHCSTSAGPSNDILWLQPRHFYVFDWGQAVTQHSQSSPGGHFQILPRICNFTSSNYTLWYVHLATNTLAPLSLSWMWRISGQGVLIASQSSLISCLFTALKRSVTERLRGVKVSLCSALLCTCRGEVPDSKTPLTAWENINYYDGFPPVFWCSTEKRAEGTREESALQSGQETPANVADCCFSENHKNVCRLWETFFQGRGSIWRQVLN